MEETCVGECVMDLEATLIPGTAAQPVRSVGLWAPAAQGTGYSGFSVTRRQSDGEVTLFVACVSFRIS